ncbi:hypothetical protein CTEN210_05795 [Chaetoceros tenuissimus]|uniref:RING-type domain-containing protein n=1 Tax=Chaetoceros tenuissimus TaxID=426638 RepID=A0AAD3CRA4_9STRA|nr:hypothetical protein CTEN210_05795 [Chaetoceros tenuissimus]
MHTKLLVVLLFFFASSLTFVSSCTDVTVNGGQPWYNSDGPTFTCAWHEKVLGSLCRISVESQRNFGMLANEACCACGGGITTTVTSTSWRLWSKPSELVKGSDVQSHAWDVSYIQFFPTTDCSGTPIPNAGTAIHSGSYDMANSINFDKFGPHNAFSPSNGPFWGGRPDVNDEFYIGMTFYTKHEVQCVKLDHPWSDNRVNTVWVQAFNTITNTWDTTYSKTNLVQTGNLISSTTLPSASPTIVMTSVLSASPTPWPTPSSWNWNNNDDDDDDDDDDIDPTTKILAVLGAVVALCFVGGCLKCANNSSQNANNNAARSTNLRTRPAQRTPQQTQHTGSSIVDERDVRRQFILTNIIHRKVITKSSQSNGGNQDDSGESVVMGTIADNSQSINIDEGDVIFPHEAIIRERSERIASMRLSLNHEELGGDEEQGGGIAINDKKDDICIETLRSIRSEMNIHLDMESLDESLYSPRSCPICCEGYVKGDDVAWSKNEECCHAFHTDCIVPWLMDHDDCPMCRCVYVKEGGRNVADC